MAKWKWDVGLAMYNIVRFLPNGTLQDGIVIILGIEHALISIYPSKVIYVFAPKTIHF